MLEPFGEVGGDVPEYSGKDVRNMTRQKDMRKNSSKNFPAGVEQISNTLP